MIRNCLPFVLLITVLAGPASAQKIPATAVIPDDLPVKAKSELTPWRAQIETARAGLAARAVEQNKNCNPAPPDSTAKAKCREGQAKFNEDVQDFVWDVNEFNDQVRGYVVIAGLNTLAKTLPGWTPDERQRLDAALNDLDQDGNREKSRKEIRDVWSKMLVRGDELKAEAERGNGPNLSGAGTQTSFNDCAVFALANASGQPYGIVAARVTKLIREGNWREADERSDPQGAIERRGLMAGEVVMMAEALGQVKIVKSADFAKTLAGGRAVMINVFPSNGNAHEVVLSRTFSHGGETWFEMMDSNQGPIRRLYLSQPDLMKILKESGVVYAPDPGTTPRPPK